jgi:hypothetical protein
VTRGETIRARADFVFDDETLPMLALGANERTLVEARLVRLDPEQRGSAYRI